MLICGQQQLQKCLYFFYMCQEPQTTESIIAWTAFLLTSVLLHQYYKIHTICVCVCVCGPSHKSTANAMQVHARPCVCTQTHTHTHTHPCTHGHWAVHTFGLMFLQQFIQLIRTFYSEGSNFIPQWAMYLQILACTNWNFHLYQSWNLGSLKNNSPPPSSPPC